MTDPGIKTHQLIAGRYRIERELGRGGSAVVYRALDERHDRRVAVKVLHPELATALGAQRFLREIKLTASLQHPHIVPIFDSGETEDGLLFYVMPHVEADSLRRELSAVGRLRIDEALRIAREIAGALAYAHERGLIHRDIKPENILFLGGHACLTDFGIARPIRTSGGERLTHHDVIVGTPEYMSPEQGRNYVLDGRSDVYSLACVLYEMLAGVPPFQADTPVNSLRQRFAQTPPPIRSQRAEVPPAVEEVLSRALATSPDERYESARAFADELAMVSGASAEVSAAGRARRGRSRRRKWLWPAGIAAGALVVLGAALASPGLRGAVVGVANPPLDDEAFVIAPVLAGAGSSASTGGAEAIRRALAEWRDLRVVDAPADAGVGDAAQRRLLGAARDARAANVIAVQVARDDSGEMAHATLYDTRSGRAARSVAIALAHGATVADSAPALVRALLAAGAPKAAAPGVAGTRSYAALLAYQRGHQALAKFDLAGAARGFIDAAEADTAFAAAQTWLAQARLWQRTGGWEEPARHAGTLRASLGGSDTLVADALEAMRTRQNPRACEAYASLAAGDSTNVYAQLGLGDCRALDQMVATDPKSPSGWSFRGSIHSAIAAYDRAVRLDPRAYAALPVSYLRGLLHMGAITVRLGRRDGDPGWYAGSPILVHDTLGYFAWPASTASGLTAAERSLGSLDDALRWNRETLLRFLNGELARDPRSADALEGVAAVLEYRGALVDDGSGSGLSALRALDSALHVTTDPEARARIGSSRVRVLIKAGEFRRARLAADSLLSHADSAPPTAAHWLAMVAEVTGRASLAAKLLMIADRPDELAPEPIPRPIRIASRALTARAALGVCDDSLRRDFRALNQLLDSYVEPKLHDQTALLVLFRPITLAVPCLGPRASLVLSGSNERLVAIQHALATGHPEGVRAQLDTLGRIRHVLRPGDVSLDYTVQEAWAEAAAGDSAGAVRRLDLVLNALPTLGPTLLDDIGSAAGMGRALALRAELATRLHDAPTATRWTQAVAELWANADLAVQRTVTTLAQGDRR